MSDSGKTEVLRSVSCLHCIRVQEVSVSMLDFTVGVLVPAERDLDRLFVIFTCKAILKAPP